MNRKRRTAAALLTAFLVLSGCAKQKAVVPVTTSSEPARELYLEGRALLDSGRVTEAHDRFVQAVGQDLNFALAHLGLAEAYRMRDMKEKAVEHYKAYLDILPGGPEATVARRMIEILGQQ